jgi:hypothetical protein
LEEASSVKTSTSFFPSSIHQVCPRKKKKNWNTTEWEFIETEIFEPHAKRRTADSFIGSPSSFHPHYQNHIALASPIRSIEGFFQRAE